MKLILLLIAERFLRYMDKKIKASDEVKLLFILPLITYAMAVIGLLVIRGV